MSFLSRLGFAAVGSFEPSPIENVVKDKSTDIKTLVFKHPKIPFRISDFNARYFFTGHRVYIDHESGYIRTKMRIDDEDDILIEDYDCPDCLENGGCSHCEREHLDDHVCLKVQPLGFIRYVVVLEGLDTADFKAMEGIFRFIEGRGWFLHNKAKWLPIKLPVDESIKGEFFARFV